MDHALFLQAGAIDGQVLGVGNERPVASLGDAEAVNGKLGGFGQRLVDFLGRGIGRYLELLGELSDGFTWR